MLQTMDWDPQWSWARAYGENLSLVRHPPDLLLHQNVSLSSLDPIPTRATDQGTGHPLVLLARNLVSLEQSQSATSLLVTSTTTATRVRASFKAAPTVLCLEAMEGLGLSASATTPTMSTARGGLKSIRHRALSTATGSTASL